MKKIGIDGRIFHSPITGTGKYLIQIMNIITELIKGDVEFFIYCQHETSLNDAHFKYRIIRDNSFFVFLKPVIWLKTICSFYIRKNKIDFFIGGAGFLPYLSSDIKTMIVIHDFNHILVPETLTTTQRISHQLFYKADVKRSDFIIANSVGTYEKCIQYFNIKPNIIINPPVPSIFKPIDKAWVIKRLNKWDISYPYFLAVATLEPRKNLDKLILAFLSLKQKGELKQHKLVLVGKFGWKDENVKMLIKANQEEIKYLGYIADVDLPILYNGAFAFIFPSVYEGYGMPVSEALACNVPIITTDIVELREASNNKAYYIKNVHDVQSIENAFLMFNHLDNKETKNDVIVKDSYLEDITAFLN